MIAGTEVGSPIGCWCAPQQKVPIETTENPMTPSDSQNDEKKKEDEICASVSNGSESLMHSSKYTIIFKKLLAMFVTIGKYINGHSNGLMIGVAVKWCFSSIFSASKNFVAVAHIGSKMVFKVHIHYVSMLL